MCVVCLAYVETSPISCTHACTKYSQLIQLIQLIVSSLYIYGKMHMHMCSTPHPPPYPPPSHWMHVTCLTPMARGHYIIHPVSSLIALPEGVVLSEPF